MKRVRAGTVFAIKSLFIRFWSGFSFCIAACGGAFRPQVGGTRKANQSGQNYCRPFGAFLWVREQWASCQ